MRVLTYWAYWAGLLIVGLFMLWISPARAYQGHCPCGAYIVYHQREWPNYSYRERVCRRCYEARGYRYSHRDRDDDDRYDYRREQCIGVDVDVISTEHQSEENARESARKLWMAATQWRYGGQYMNLEEAAHIRWQCGPSNAMDTISGKIAEAAGVLTGRGGQNVRCALFARPCRTEKTQGDDRRRR